MYLTGIRNNKGYLHFKILTVNKRQRQIGTSLVGIRGIKLLLALTFIAPINQQKRFDFLECKMSDNNLDLLGIADNRFTACIFKHKNFISQMLSMLSPHYNNGSTVDYFFFGPTESLYRVSNIDKN